MFGKTDWFRQDSTSLAPGPVARQGWLYYGMWLVVIAVPTALLVMRGQFPESAVWAAVAGGGFMLDLRRLRLDLRHQAAISRLHFVGDDQPPAVETGKYRLEIKT